MQRTNVAYEPQDPRRKVMMTPIVVLGAAFSPTPSRISCLRPLILMSGVPGTACWKLTLHILTSAFQCNLSFAASPRAFHAGWLGNVLGRPPPASAARKATRRTALMTTMPMRCLLRFPCLRPVFPRSLKLVGRPAAPLRTPFATQLMRSR